MENDKQFIPQIQDISPEARNYIETTEHDFDNLESIRLNEDGAVLIKLKSQEKEIIYKSPKELFLSGEVEALNSERKIDIIQEFPGFGAPLVLSGKSYSMKCSEINSSEKLRKFLTKDFDVGYLIASSSVNSGALDIFALAEGKYKYLEPKTLFLIDSILQTIKDENISDKARMFHFYFYIRHGSLKEEHIEYFKQIGKEKPEFMLKIIDLAIRKCLTSGHDWSFEVFRILESQPDLYNQLDQIHKDYSLPYLFERDAYLRWLHEEKGFKDQTKEEMKKMFSDSKISLDKVRQTLKTLGSSREYCAGFFN